MITKEELYARLNEEMEDINQDITYLPEVRDPMATAVDIGEHSVSIHPKCFYFLPKPLSTGEIKKM
jgi:hypothetical protein